MAVGGGTAAGGSRAEQEQHSVGERVREGERVQRPFPARGEEPNPREKGGGTDELTEAQQRDQEGEGAAGNKGASQSCIVNQPESKKTIKPEQGAREFVLETSNKIMINQIQELNWHVHWKGRQNHP